MTPKEQAIDLWNEHLATQHTGCVICGDDHEDRCNAIKNSALITVRYLADNCTPDKVNYWSAVKSELEKL